MQLKVLFVLNETDSPGFSHQPILVVNLSILHFIYYLISWLLDLIQIYMTASNLHKNYMTSFRTTYSVTYRRVKS